MRLKTPKRYQSKYQRSSWFSLRWAWFWLFAIIAASTLFYIYQNRSVFLPAANNLMATAMGSVGEGLSTVIAPTPTATADPSGAILQADAAWDRGAIEDAQILYTSVIEAAPNNVRVHYRYTLSLLMNGQRQEAVSAAENLVTAAPFDSNAWALRAMVLDWNGRYTDAMSSALRAIELDGENARAYAFLAEIYFELGQNTRALDTLARALEIDPNSFEAYRAQGLLELVINGDVDAARAAYEEAIALEPQIIYPYLDLASLEINSSLYDDAIARLRGVLDLNPTNNEALYLLAVAYYRGLGDPSQAREFVNRCVDANPNNNTCQYYLGRMLLVLEQPQQALEHLMRPIQNNTTSPIHYYWAAQGQVLNGNCPAAVPLLENGLRLAQEQDFSAVFDDFEVSLRECGRGAAIFTPTPAVAESTAETGS
jgi:tetratricopeptide (TPR) repeat protein